MYILLKKYKTSITVISKNTITQFLLFSNFQSFNYFNTKIHNNNKIFRIFINTFAMNYLNKKQNLPAQCKSIIKKTSSISRTKYWMISFKCSYYWIPHIIIICYSIKTRLVYVSLQPFNFIINFKSNCGKITNIIYSLFECTENCV